MEQIIEEEMIDESMIDEEHLDDQAEAFAEDSYDRFRDEQADKLDEVLTDTYNMFVLCKDRGYYKGHAERFVEHTIAMLTSKTDTHIVMKGKQLSVVANAKVKQNSLMDFTKEQIDKAEQKGLIEVKKDETAN